MLFFATVVLIILKVTGVLTISWLVAFSPILVGLALSLVLFILSFVFVGSAAFFAVLLGTLFGGGRRRRYGRSR